MSEIYYFKYWDTFVNLMCVIMDGPDGTWTTAHLDAVQILNGDGRQWLVLLPGGRVLAVGRRTVRLLGLVRFAIHGGILAACPAHRRTTHRRLRRQHSMGQRWRRRRQRRLLAHSMQLVGVVWMWVLMRMGVVRMWMGM